MRCVCVLSVPMLSFPSLIPRLSCGNEATLSPFMLEEHGTESDSTKYIIAIDGFQGVWLHFRRASAGGLCSVQL